MALWHTAFLPPWVEAADANIVLFVAAHAL
jgi:hypothetical protein